MHSRGLHFEDNVHRDQNTCINTATMKHYCAKSNAGGYGTPKFDGENFRGWL